MLNAKQHAGRLAQQAHAPASVKPIVSARQPRQAQQQRQRTAVSCGATATNVKLPASHLESSKKALEQLKESATNSECKPGHEGSENALAHEPQPRSGQSARAHATPRGDALLSVVLCALIARWAPLAVPGRREGLSEPPSPLCVSKDGPHQLASVLCFRAALTAAAHP